MRELKCQRSPEENFCLSKGSVHTRTGADFPFFCARFQNFLEHIAAVSTIMCTRSDRFDHRTLTRLECIIRYSPS